MKAKIVIPIVVVLVVINAILAVGLIGHFPEVLTRNKGLFDVAGLEPVVATAVVFFHFEFIALMIACACAFVVFVITMISWWEERPGR